MKKRSDAVLQIRLPSEMRVWLKDYAERHKTFMSEVIRDALEEIRTKDLRELRRMKNTSR